MEQNLQEKISTLISKYEHDRDFYRSAGFNETLLRSDFLDPFFEILGWDIKNMSGKRTNEREVLLEEPLKTNAAAHAKKPDYTFRLFGERKFFVEAKKPCVDISREEAPARQVRRYGYTAGLKISVLSNFEDLYIYDTTYPVKESDSNVKAIIKHYHYTEYENCIEDIAKLLGRESVYNGQFDEIWSEISNDDIQKKNIDELFLAQINTWRLMLGNEILAAMPAITMAELGDVVQGYINKILFLRVCEDRNIEAYQRLLLAASHESYAELITLFRNADKKYNSGLFEEQLSNVVIEDVSSSFWTIIKHLYYPECPYSFAVLSSDILGRIYEIFLSKRFALQEGELVLVDKPENVDKDIVSTPLVIVREILRQTVEENLYQMDDTQLMGIKCADIACGSGAFLLELYQLLCDRLVDYYIEHDKSQLVQVSSSTYKLGFATKRRVMENCIYGIDKDYNAVEACKFGLLLKLLEGEDEVSLAKFHPILPSLDGNIFYGNSLLETADVPEENAESINPFDFGELRFDFIVGNPPYLKTEDIKSLTPLEYKLYPKKYSCAYKQYDKYFIFMQRALELLNADGSLGYIVPNKFMKVGAGKMLRKLIADGKYLKSIVSYGANLVFADKSTYTSLVILQKREHGSFSYTEVNDYKQWKLRSAKASSSCKRSEDTINGSTWLLYPDDVRHLIEEKIWAKSIPLGQLVGEDYVFNGIQTSAIKIYSFETSQKDDKYYYFCDTEGGVYKIEKTATKPYFKTEHGEGALNTYRSFQPNARVIFPYHKNKKGKLNLMKLSYIQKKFPYLYSYLMDHKDILSRPSRNILPKPSTQDEWYRYGRHQSLEACEIPNKIIVGVLSQADKYAVDTHGTLVSSGGTAGYCLISLPKESPYSIYYIQAILGSIQGEWLASLYGEIFRGGYIARGTKVLKQIPIRTINFGNAEEKAAHDDIVDRQKKLIKLGDKIAATVGNKRTLTPLLRQFKKLKEEQQEAINALYGMSKEEEMLIPRIKDLYAINRER